MGSKNMEKGMRGDEMANGYKNRSGWTASIWETRNGKDEEKRMGKREWRKWRRGEMQREADRVEEETRVEKKVSGGGETMGRRKWRSGEYARFCSDTNIGMWEGVCRSEDDDTKRRRMM